MGWKRRVETGREVPSRRREERMKRIYLERRMVYKERCKKKYMKRRRVKGSKIDSEKKILDRGNRRIE